MTRCHQIFIETMKTLTRTGADITDIQDAILNEAERYTNQTNRREILPNCSTTVEEST